MIKFYPDISHHHPIHDWSKIKKHCPFIISKATQGTSFVDPTLTSFINQCERLKIPYWLYTYLNKGNEIAQAKFLVKTCKNKTNGYFMGYILDVEEDNHPQDVLEALTWLEKQGEKCMVYIGYRHYEKYETVRKQLGDNTAYWESRYGLNDGFYNDEYPPHKDVDLHQFTDNGKIDGIKDKIDLNRLTGRKGEAWFKTPISLNSSSSLLRVAREVIKGKWGNGEDRKRRLEKAGYDYAKVQAKVNTLLNRKKSNYTIAKEVINGYWGDGSTRKTKLENVGYDYEAIQKIVNELM